MKYPSLGIVAVLAVIGVSSCAAEPSRDTTVNVRCFYGPSHSYSSRSTALNGAMFVEVVDEGGDLTCNAVLYHKSAFYRCTIHNEPPDPVRTG